MPRIEIDIYSENVTMDGKPVVTVQDPAHIPHNLVVAATLDTGMVRIKANNAKLKHIRGNEYHLTFD